MGNFYKNKKILITGADGFIGSHLVDEFNHRGNNVFALVNYNSWSSTGWLSDQAINSKLLEIKFGDIRDSFFINSIFKNDIDIIFHLSSLIDIPYSYIAPKSYLETNITGCLNILEASKNHSVEKIVHISTSEVYGTAQYAPIDELHPINPQSPYAASKVSADYLAMSYKYSFNLPILIARPFNTYGPRQTSRAIIPTVISQLIRGNNLSLGNINPTRDFSYVFDTVSGLIEIGKLNNEYYGEIFNIGTGNDISIKQMIELVACELSITPNINLDPSKVRPKDSEVMKLQANSNKLQAASAWRPTVDIKTGLKYTINWIKDNIEFF